MSIDFSKLAKQPREIDYLAYLIDEHKLTEWESGFCKSCIKGLREKYQWLTPRQRACLDKMVDKYKLKTDEFCVRGFADREMHEVMNDKGAGTTSTKMAQAGDKEILPYNPNAKPTTGWDDMDDDIPF